MLTNSSILISGGTGSFGKTFVPLPLAKFNPRRMIIFSRDEMKQWEMAKLFSSDNRVRFFIGDVRDKDRLSRAIDGIDYVDHAAALACNDDMFRQVGLQSHLIEFCERI